MQCLSAPAAEEGDCDITILRERERFDLPEHSAADIVLALEDLWSNRKDTCPDMSGRGSTAEPDVVTDLSPYDVQDWLRLFGKNLLLIGEDFLLVGKDLFLIAQDLILISKYPGKLFLICQNLLLIPDNYLLI
jgi:hypothetical protein